MKPFTFDFSKLAVVVAKMGTSNATYKTADFRPSFIEREIDEKDWQDISINHDLLEYQGQKVMLYIMDHSSNFKYDKTFSFNKLSQGDEGKGNKIHVTGCQTIINMKTGGRFARYIAITPTNQKLKVAGVNQDKKAIEGEARLHICKNCIKSLGLTVTNASNYDFEGLYENYRSNFSELPDSSLAEKSAHYSGDWDAVSKSYRKSQGYSCEDCAVNLTDHQNLLHTHHINGIKGDNKRKNLQALCVICHAKQPFHGHMKIQLTDRQIIQQLRVSQRRTVV